MPEGQWRHNWRTVGCPTSEDLLGVHVWSPDRAVCVGKNGACLSWDGRRWADAGAGFDEDLYAVWGPSPEEVFAVGGNLHVGGHSKVCHLASGAWTVRPSGIQSLLLAVSGTSADDVMAVGFNGGIVRRSSDDRFEETTAGTNDHLFAVSAASDGTWLVAGLNGTLRRRGIDGAWTALAVTAAHLNGAWFDTADDGVAVAHNGEVLCCTSGRWETAIPAPDGCLYDVSSGDGRSYVAVGARGLILEGNSEAGWRTLRETDAALHGVGVAEGLTVAVGARGTILHRD
jgi:hypothetical protein